MAKRESSVVDTHSLAEAGMQHQRKVRRRREHA